MLVCADKLQNTSDQLKCSLQLLMLEDVSLQERKDVQKSVHDLVRRRKRNRNDTLGRQVDRKIDCLPIRAYNTQYPASNPYVDIYSAFP